MGGGFSLGSRGGLDERSEKSPQGYERVQTRNVEIVERSEGEQEKTSDRDRDERGWTFEEEEEKTVRIALAIFLLLLFPPHLTQREDCEGANFCVPEKFEGKVPEGLTPVECTGSCGKETGCREGDQETPFGCSRYCCKAKCGCRCV